MTAFRAQQLPSTTTTFTVPATEVHNALIVDLTPHKKSVAWEDSVIDNEHLGKKSSKKCCIYHKPRRFDESSTESSSDGGPQRTKPPCKHHLGEHEHAPVIAEIVTVVEQPDPHTEQDV